MIKLSEKKGTGGVQPHNAILKGEMLDRIIVRYYTKSKMSWSGPKLTRSIVVKLYTSATVWEFKREVAKMLGLSPKYIKLKLPNDEILRSNQHGMTLQQLGLKNGDALKAYKKTVEEQVVAAELIDPTNKCLVQRAIDIFSEWYDIYKN